MLRTSMQAASAVVAPSVSDVPYPSSTTSGRASFKASAWSCSLCEQLVSFLQPSPPPSCPPVRQVLPQPPCPVLHSYPLQPVVGGVSPYPQSPPPDGQGSRPVGSPRACRLRPSLLTAGLTSSNAYCWD